MVLRFSDQAAEVFRRIPLFERLALVDLFDDLRIGKIPIEDYGDITEEGLPVSVLIIGRFSISFAVHEASESILVAEISSADE